MSDFDERARRAAEGVKRAIEDADVNANNGERVAKRRVAKRTAAISTATAVVLLAGIVGFYPSHDKGVPVASSTGKNGAFQLAGALQPFNACDDALAYFKDHAADYYVSQYSQDRYRAYDNMAGSGTASAPVTTMVPPQAMKNAETDSPSPSNDVATSAPQFSTTNVAEKNVDEPDIVKTDGSRIITVTNGRVKILSANNGNPVVRSTLSDQNVQNIFLVGDRLVLLRSSQPNYGPNFRTPAFDMPVSSQPGGTSTAAIYDVADITNPRAVGSIDVTGSIVDARMVGTQVRLVTTYTPDVEVSPTFNNNGSLTDESVNKLKDTIANSKIADWTPTFTLHDGSGATTGSGQLVTCGDLGHPQAFSGIGTTSLVTFDANSSLSSRHSAGVVAGGQQIYATEKTLYVTSTNWTPNSDVANTDIHAFATDDAGVVKYEGSGSVAGTLLNQYSMSEFNGALRVATTDHSEHGWINRRSITQGQVAVLKLQDNKLQQVGIVTGLGAADNETVQSVRFVGTRGYVTTFRQTDPFYVIDLSDPTAPKVAGQLKIPGFSSYLHPISDTLILGVGQSGGGVGGGAPTPMATPETTIPGQGKDLAPGTVMPIAPSNPGVEFSLFDVSDPANPKKVGSQIYGAGQAGAQADPKAFLYYQPMNLIVSPLTTYTMNYGLNGNGTWSGLVLLRPTASGLTEVGRLENVDPNTYDVLRTFIIDSNVYQLSNNALQVNSLDTHKDIAKVGL